MRCDEATLTPLAGDVERFGREPFGYAHNLSLLGLFSSESLRALAEKYVQHDYFVASGAPSPATPFYAVAHGKHTPSTALAEIDAGVHRILLKRPEKYDRGFRELLTTLFERVIALRGGLGKERVVRLESSVLISSAAAITPFHFDPELSFFFQIEGEKVYHLYSPSVLSELELERFYVKGIVNIGQVASEGRDPKREYVFTLGPGKGMHQPQNAPHWVETRATRSVSYVFSFETDVTRAVGRTRSYNHYLRRIGGRPAPPGKHPSLDAFKASAMQVAMPLRKRLAVTLRSSLRRNSAEPSASATS